MTLRSAAMSSAREVGTGRSLSTMTTTITTMASAITRPRWRCHSGAGGVASVGPSGRGSARDDPSGAGGGARSSVIAP